MKRTPTIQRANAWRNVARVFAPLAAALLIVFASRVAVADFSSTPLAPPAFGGDTLGSAAVAASRLPALSQQPHPAVARIIVPERDGTSYGTATLVDVTESQGLVITNWHVVESQSGPITVVFPDGFRSQATVLKHDPTWDLAALSIWKPNVDPVRIAADRAKPGDLLAIAGYGGGDYRMAAGRCTQYVAPGPRQPFEMVEMSAAARQGDSGGPILNERGEIVGVLFGEGDGKTAGSDAGRVAQFLAPIRGVQNTNLSRLTADRTSNTPSGNGWRAADDSPSPFSPAAPSVPAFPAFATGQPAPADPMASRIAPSNLSPAGPASPNAAANHTPGGWSWPNAAPQPGAISSATSTTPPPSNDAPSPLMPDARPSYPPPAAATTTTANPPAADPNAAGEDIRNFLGATRFEQAKSILAIIGVIAIVVTFSKAFAKA